MVICSISYKFCCLHKEETSMGLFGKKKAAAAGPEEANASIKILGSGCAKCNALEESVRRAIAELGWTEPVGHVTDFGQIAAYGVMSTPALVVDGKVVSAGRLLTQEEAKALLLQARG